MRILAIAGVLAAAILGIALVMRPSSTVSGAEPSMLDGSTGQKSHRAGAASSHLPKQANQKSNKRDEPTVDTLERDIKLSERKRRADESDAQFDIRIKFLDRFEKFEEKASISQEQRQAVIGIMADMQLQSLLAWEQIRLAVHPSEMPSMSNIDKTLRAEILSRLREVLDHDQMVHFRRTAIIGLPLQFGDYKPIEGAEFEQFTQNER